MGGPSSGKDSGAFLRIEGKNTRRNVPGALEVAGVNETW